ncbi:MAG: type IV pilus biogenesis/stability protein PilW [Gammaproteobacteria bacterium]|nr:type IV pilus biogenesis/stability protein PilW [Gammaproteobacteria bacterium]
MKIRFGLVGALAIMALAGCASLGQSGAVSPDEVARTNLDEAGKYYRLGQYDVALDKLRKAAAAKPQDSQIHELLATTYARVGDLKQAEYYYRKALQYVPRESAEFGEYSNNYGVFLCNKTDYSDAESYFVQAVANPWYRTPQLAYENAGNCAERAGADDKAKELYAKALALQPDMPQSLLALARMSVDQQDYAAAADYLQRYDQKQPANAESVWLAARVAKARGELARAEKMEQRLKSQFPASPWAIQLAQPE